MIVKFLRTNPVLKPRKFVGQATKSKKDKGMSQKEQISVLKEFKGGKYNILVATSVAEEGLDIAECNMVVFYDNVASEIKYIQRAGRTGRSSAGKVILLYTIGTSDELHMNLAKLKKSSMRKNLTKGVKHQKRRAVNSTKKPSVEIPNTIKSSPIYVIPQVNEKYRICSALPPTLSCVKSKSPNKFDFYIPAQSIGIDFKRYEEFEFSPHNFSYHRTLFQKRKEVERYMIFLDVMGIDKPKLREISSNIPKLTFQLKIPIVLFTSIDSLHRKIHGFFNN